jgi:hypothetical protein
MARSVVGYIRQFLNSSATASPTQSVEATTGIQISTGINAGVYQEFSDAEAQTYDSQALVGVQILTAGSGQTPGTFLLTSSTGGAVISVVVAAGGTVTAVPTIVTPGKFLTDVAPTFTLAAGGTPATFNATLGFLYSGVYAFAQLDPAVTGAALPVGTPLYWLQSSSTFPVVTTGSTGNFPDFAGWTIDPNFGPALPFAFIQQSGKGKVLISSATGTPAFGDTLNLVANPGTSFVTTTGQGAATALTVGYSLAPAVTSVSGATTLARVTRYISRF